jgi:putative oxidoreductase
MSELLYTLGRVLIPVIFVVFGVEQITNVAPFADQIAAANLPFPTQIEQYLAIPKYQALAYLVSGIEIAAGLAVLIGLLTRIAALVLFVFCGATIFFVDHFWNMEAPAQVGAQSQALMYLALMGALLLLMGKGAGGFSLDGTGGHPTAKVADGASAAHA